MRRELKIILAICAVVCMSALLAACAPQMELEKPDIVWPLPPDKPRIRWVAAYSSAADIEERSHFLESLIGADVGDSPARPQGVTVDSRGTAYVSDTVSGRIFIFDVQAKKLRILTGATAQPLGLAIAERSNTLFITSVTSKSVTAVDLKTGKVKFIIGQEVGFFRNPVGVAVDEQRGRIYVTDSKLSELRAFDMNGKFISTVARSGLKDDQVYVPSEVFVDREGKVYVADTMNFKVKIFGPDGSFIRAIGGLGDTSGHLSRPYGVAVDSDGHIYVSDANFCNVQIFDQQGRVLLAFGNSGSGPGLFIAPMQMWIDKDDKIYVTDSLNRRIQVFQYLKEQ